MVARILDGQRYADVLKDHIKLSISKRNEQGLTPPGLSVILVGDNPASWAYVTHKKKACEAVGITFTLHHLPEEISASQLRKVISDCNADTAVHGILLQLPLPSHLNEDDLLEQISVQKDVDGFHPYNLGRLAQSKPLFRPCTSYGVIQLLTQTGQTLRGSHAVVVGASNIVGRPMALELLLSECTVTICHKFTRELSSHVQRADILIAGIGKPGVIESNWLKQGAIVVDVGFSRTPTGEIRGDIDFPTAKERAGWITPVPGGVGPMTVATLLQNTLKAAEGIEI